NKKSEFEFEVKNVEAEKLKAKDEIEKIKKQTAEDAHKILLQKQQSLTEENSILEEKINDTTQKLNDFYSTLSRVNDYNSLVEEINYLKRRKEDLDKEKESVEKAVSLKKATLNSPQLLEKAVEIQTLTTLLNGGRVKESSPKIYKTKITPSTIKLTKENRNDYINYLIDSFSNDNGRNFSFDEMSNLLICLNQSFMTILAGPPGTGKTSTAIRLAQSMGLTSEENTYNTSNFINIPVGRAWVSSRDILGFYNSLKDVYQPARTGLYEFLKSDHNQDYLKLILLDEANLSSVEHYWSDFLGMCDPEGRNRKIDSGIPSDVERHINISKSVRFIATINNDASTERLSPRLIDRVPVISLNHNSEFKSNLLKTIDFDGAINNESLESCFDVNLYESSFTTEEENSLEQIIEILRTPINRTTSIRVSQRKYNAIKRYCHVANEIEGLRVQPLDFAINQHILPLIEGYGSGFKERLHNLEQKLVELDLNISKATLKNIINNGDIYSESYSYF
ncbi:AAA family ATPase, partial [Escherichia coli H8]|nr:AAA family ATPase [Escherichia coli H8]